MICPQMRATALATVRMRQAQSAEKIVRKPTCAESLRSRAPRRTVVHTSWMSARRDFRSAIDLSNGFKILRIPHRHTGRLASIPYTKKCQGRRKLRPRCCNWRTIQTCLTNGPPKAGRRLRRTARFSLGDNDRVRHRNIYVAYPEAGNTAA